MTDKFVPTRIVVTAHPKLPDALKEAGAISEYLKGKGIDAPHGSLNDEDLRKQVKQGKFDMLVSVGGDGTMLRAAHLCAPCGVPILGINHGRLGFLFQTESHNWQGMIDILLKGEAWIETA
jgi:NAD+ kinase